MTLTATPQPFPHVVADGLWSDELLDAAAAEFPAGHDPSWRRFANQHEHKLGRDHQLGSGVRGLLDRIAALAPQLEATFAIPDLTMETVGGGMHAIPPGGHLDIHTDFNRSPVSGLYRRLNAIVFLNRGWDDPGGWLELHPTPQADRAPQPTVIAPEWNRTVVFATSDRSWHGHPEPTRHRWRHSIAAYFYSAEPHPGHTGDHSTVWAVR